MSEWKENTPEQQPVKVLLLALDMGRYDMDRSMDELSALAEANNMEAVAQIVQKRGAPEAGTVLGIGKLEEAKLYAMNLGAEAAIFDGELQDRWRFCAGHAVPAALASAAAASDNIPDREERLPAAFADNNSAYLSPRIYCSTVFKSLQPRPVPRWAIRATDV